MVWRALAPHAVATRTLTPATALAFQLLCRNILLERELGGRVLDRGSASHRGMLQRVQAGLLAFNLAPCGKAMEVDAPATPVVDPLDRFTKRAGRGA